MAIVKVPNPNTRVVLNGNNMITVSPQGGQIMQKSNNNRARGSASRAKQLAQMNGFPPDPDGAQPQIPSSDFQALDQLIYFLDGIYDQLPAL